MPNIIEQQDLLKGLPDNRLAMLMQNPTGDIPPFLVAAEAQRRQAIRAQFSGGPQESVVDTLTKQLSNVPQNIQAPAQTPPRMPPPVQPQMGGVAGLQQGMRDGGMVQRYQDLGLVRPTVDSLAKSITGMTEEEYIAEQERKKIESLGPGRARYLLENPTVPKTEAQIAEEGLKAATEGPLSGFYSPQSVYEAAQAVEKAKGQISDPFKYGMTTEERRMMQTAPKPETASTTPVIPTNPDAGKEDTSLENKRKATQKMLEDVYGTSAEDSAYIQQKLRELYGDNEPSDWEKAQKWFAAAQAAVQPNQTNTQAAINALAALGGGFAEEGVAKRASDRDLAEALLKLEISDRQAQREATQNIAKGMYEFERSEEANARAMAAAARQEQIDAYKLYATTAGGTIDDANSSLMDIRQRRKDYIESLPKDEITGQTKIDPNDTYLKDLDGRARYFENVVNGALALRGQSLAGVGGLTGTNPTVEVFTGDSLATFNR